MGTVLKRHFLFRIFVVIAILLLTPQKTRGQNEIVVAAASDLRFAVDSVISLFKEGDVKVTYGSSGKFTQQILNGAPFHIFMSADLAYLQLLQERNKTGSEVYRYGKGRLVIYCTKVKPQATGIEMLMDRSIRKIAIANREHAPYGKRTIETFNYYNMTDKIKSKLIYGDNITQAAQFIISGGADVGVIALSLAVGARLRKQGQYLLIPEESHSPLVQGAVITAHGKDSPTAKAFFTFMKGAQAAQVLQHFGFTKPD